jgi:hypothetical protein
MEPLARFLEYAAAFEKVVETDDWKLLEPFFTEDAVYEIRGTEPFSARHRGRDAIFEGLKRSLDAMDRRFETRELEVLEGPELREGAVWLKWRASYRSPGVPELVLDGVETAEFEGDRIVRLTDIVPLEMSAITRHWLDHYESLLSASAG